MSLMLIAWNGLSLTRSDTRLNEAVKRNQRRFPSDFMFQLKKKESESLTSQFAISKKGRGGRRTLPYAFTEQGNTSKYCHHARVCKAATDAGIESGTQP